MLRPDAACSPLKKKNVAWRSGYVLEKLPITL